MRNVACCCCCCCSLIFCVPQKDPSKKSSNIHHFPIPAQAEHQPLNSRDVRTGTTDLPHNPAASRCHAKTTKIYPGDSTATMKPRSESNAFSCACQEGNSSSSSSTTSIRTMFDVRPIQPRSPESKHLTLPPNFFKEHLKISPPHKPMRMPTLTKTTTTTEDHPLVVGEDRDDDSSSSSSNGSGQAPSPIPAPSMPIRMPSLTNIAVRSSEQNEPENHQARRSENTNKNKHSSSSGGCGYHEDCRPEKPRRRPTAC